MRFADYDPPAEPSVVIAGKLVPADDAAIEQLVGSIMPEIYLTKEQVQRIAAICCDTLYGVQIGSTPADNTRAYVVMMDIDSMTNRHFEVEVDGSYKEVT